MSDVKTGYFLPKSLFDVCLVDSVSIKEIQRKFPSRSGGAYILDKFINYIKANYNLSLQDYCERYLNLEWPRCPIDGLKTGFKINGKGVNISTFHTTVTKEFSPRFKAACDKMSKERMGEGNPMYGAPAWNKGLDRSNEIINKMALQKEGVPLKEEHRRKLCLARAKHPLKARHTQPHSKETKKKFRIHTAKLWATGVFNRESSLETKTRDFLKELNLLEPFVFQHQIKYYTVDFAFVDAKIAIECQGTYFHIDPRKYPNGPIDKIQRRNFGRDKAKRKYCCERCGWKIIEIWETEINNGKFKDYLICKFRELNLLKE